MNGSRALLAQAVHRNRMQGLVFKTPEMIMVAQTPRVTCSLIIEIVALDAGVRRAVITGDCRRAPSVDARHLAMWLCHQVTGQNLSQIARAFGDRDHTTSLSAINAFPKRRAENPDLDARAARLLAIIEGALQ